MIHRPWPAWPSALHSRPRLRIPVPDHLRSLTADGVLVLYGADFSGLHLGSGSGLRGGISGRPLQFGLHGRSGSRSGRFFRIDDLVVQVPGPAAINHHQLAASRSAGCREAVVHLLGRSSRCCLWAVPASTAFAVRARLCVLEVVPGTALCYPGSPGVGGPRIRCRAAERGSGSRSALADWLGRPSPDDRSYRLEREHLYARHRRARSTLPTFFGWSGATPTSTSRGLRGMTSGCTAPTSLSRPAEPGPALTGSRWPISVGLRGSTTSATTPS